MTVLKEVLAMTLQNVSIGCAVSVVFPVAFPWASYVSPIWGFLRLPLWIPWGSHWMPVWSPFDVLVIPIQLP